LNGLHKKVLTRVFGTHAAVLFLLLFIPWVRGCVHPKPKIITFIDLGAPPPPEIASEPEPEPAPKVEKPVPAPPKTNAPPKTVKTNAPPKKAEPKKTEVKKAEPKKADPKPAPKLTEAQRLAAIRQNNKVTKPSPAPAQPKLDFSGIQSALNSAASSAGSSYGSGTGSGGGSYSPFAWYYAEITKKMYAVWQQPSGAPKGLTASATLRIERNGAVSQKTLTRRSGNAPFDQSVQNALNATTRLPVPPADLPSRDIEIEFVLSD
jgi:outer membrane biosynthesis protein TonB